jgi:hypothetical protein
MAALSLVLPVSQAKMLFALTINFIGGESFPVQNTVVNRLPPPQELLKQMNHKNTVETFAFPVQMPNQRIRVRE